MKTIKLKKNIDYTIKPNEIFKNIGKYKHYDFSKHEISNYGKIRNINGSIARLNINADGYHTISLSNKGNKTLTIGVHILVATAFCESKTSLTIDVNHLDENKSNNYYKNLQWATTGHNVIYSTGKKVDQLDMITKKIIKTYDSIADATRDMTGKARSSSVCEACRGNIRSAYGYYWQYSEISDRYDALLTKYTNQLEASKKYNATIYNKINKDLLISF